MGTRLGVGPEALADYAAFSMGQSEVLPSQVWDGEQKYTVSRVVLPRRSVLVFRIGASIILVSN